MKRSRRSPLNPLIPALIGMLVLLSACASVAKHDPLLPSKPTHQSMYYFTVGAYVQNMGNFQLSGELLDKARQFDIGNPVIRKYLLLNDIYSFHSDLIGKREFESRLKRYSNSFPALMKDENVLLGLYSVYTTKKDTLEINRYLSELETDYPSSSVYLWRFYYNHSYRKFIDLASLQKAEELAVAEPENLLQIARIYTMLDPAKALEIIKRVNEIQSTPESQSLQTGLMMALNQNQPVSDLFGSYVYPRDKASMLDFLDTALDQGNLDTIERSAEIILATEDSEMLLPLATVAFSRGDIQTIHKIEAIMDKKSGTTQADSRVYAILLANAITQYDIRDLSLYASRLYTIEDIQSVLHYSAVYFAGIEGIELNELPPKVFEEINSRFDAICSDDTLTSYLQLYAMRQYAEVNMNDVIALSQKICLALIAKGYGTVLDYQIATNYLQMNGKKDELLVLLRNAVELFPDDAAFLNSYGYTLIQDPETREAGSEYVLRALDLEPETPYYLDSLAWYYYLKGDHATALNLMKIPMQQDSLPAEIYYHLGMICKALDRLPDARDWFRKAITAGDSEEFVAESRRELELLGR